MTSRNLTQIAHALAPRLPGPAIVGIVPITTGFSNETYRIEGPDLILRLPPAAGAMLEGRGVLDQGRIYRALAGMDNAPPVPRVLDICDEEGLIGVPFFVMASVPGESLHDIDLQDWFTAASEEERRRMCLDWITAIARLATLEPLEVLGEAITPEADMRRWAAFAAAADGYVVVAAIERLLRTPAPRSGPSQVVHGDPKLSNLMWHDKQITALLDWEMALNGEPLGDLAYLLYGFESPFHPPSRAQKLPGMIGRDEVIAVWSQVSGRSADGLAWHEIAQMAKLCSILTAGVAMIRSGRSSDPKLAIFQQTLDTWIAAIDAMLDAGGF